MGTDNFSVCKNVGTSTKQGWERLCTKQGLVQLYTPSHVALLIVVSAQMNAPSVINHGNQPV